MPIELGEKLYLSAPEIASKIVELGYAKAISPRTVNYHMERPEWPVPRDECIQPSARRIYTPWDDRLKKYWQQWSQDPSRQKMRGVGREEKMARFYELIDTNPEMSMRKVCEEVGIGFPTGERWKLWRLEAQQKAGGNPVTIEEILSYRRRSG